MKKANTRGFVIWAYLQLMRPANIVTAWADVLAGAAAAGVSLALLSGQEPGFGPASLLWLLASTTGLYGGGVVFNDVFDAELDAVERPERPIPSRRATKGGAIAWGALLLLGGIAAAWQASLESAALAAFIAAAAVIYDAVAKHHTWWGPLNMGLCRGANLLLGVSVFPALLLELSPLGLIPVLYIGAITAISQGEVHGGTKRKGWLAVVLLAAVILIVSLLGVTPYAFSLLHAVAFIALFAGAVGPAFVAAARNPEAALIRNAVRRGILGLVLLNAALAAGFAGWPFGLCIVLLLPISLGLARVFAVT